MSASGRHRRLLFLGYGLYGLSVMALSYFLIFHRLISGWTLAGFYFMVPGLLFIGGLFPDLHWGLSLARAWVLSNTFMYLVVPSVVMEIIRRTRGGRMGWRDLLRFLGLFALWLALTLPRGRTCVTPGETLQRFLMGLEDSRRFLEAFPVEGLGVVTAAWLGSDRLAAWLLGPGEGPASLQPGRRASLVSLAMACALLAAWGLYGIVHCWPPRWR